MKEYAEPRMHTAEHILNGTMVKLFGRGRAFSSHIERKKSKCDYRFDRDLTPEERAELERRVNEVIRADLPVREEHVPRAEAARRFDLARLPEDTAGETLRIVHVGDYDACPCAGPHASRTGELGGLRVVSTGFEGGVLRVRFKLEPPAGAADA